MKDPSILIVEDEPLIAMNLEAIIETLGHRSSTVATGRAGEAILAEGDLVAAILDHGLPDNGCGHLALALKAANVPFAICSGAPMDELQAEFPGVAVIGKPFRDEDVTSVLTALLG